jgi:hypothetical protein
LLALELARNLNIAMPEQFPSGLSSKMDREADRTYQGRFAKSFKVAAGVRSAR